MDKLVADVEAVIRHFHRDKAVVVGHDWGGMVAWSFAMSHPEMTERLVILNLPHPQGLMRELASNPEQQKNSAYARFFQEPDAASKLTAEGLDARHYSHRRSLCAARRLKARYANDGRLAAPVIQFGRHPCGLCWGRR